MLVLTRKPDQSLIIDGPCKVRILQVRANGEVRIGIIADRSVQIVREEIADQQPRMKP